MVSSEQLSESIAPHLLFFPTLKLLFSNQIDKKQVLLIRRIIEN